MKCSRLRALVLASVAVWLAYSPGVGRTAGAETPRPTEHATRGAQGGHSRIWFLTTPAFGRLREIDPALSDAMLNHPGGYLLGKGPARNLWRGQIRGQYESYAAFAEDVRQDKVDPAVTAVAYNPEAWNYTPEAEQRDPVAYARMFTALAHQHGWISIIAPSCGLLRKMPGSAYGPVFASCAARLLAPIAPFVDILDFEAQALERDPPLYAQRVVEAANLVKRANPRVKFVAQLSTKQSQRASPDDLLQAAQSVAPYVEGFWLHIDSGNPASVAEADAFLRRFRASGG